MEMLVKVEKVWPLSTLEMIQVFQLHGREVYVQEKNLMTLKLSEEDVNLCSLDGEGRYTIWAIRIPYLPLSQPSNSVRLSRGNYNFDTVLGTHSQT